MTDEPPKLPLWPFFLAEASLLGAEALMLWLGHRPLLWWEASLMIVCAVAAAATLIIPFSVRNADEQAMAQTRLLAEAASQLQKIDQVAAQIAGATHQWREYQQHTSETAAAARSVAESMSLEARQFTEFLQKANDSERAHLRLEVEKLRRAEAEWVQILVHILDHVFALFQAANRSGQPALAEQMGHFQNSCREAARRVGLVPTLGRAGDAFDPKLHNLPENVAPNGKTRVGETVATGYLFQGQVIRRPIVTLEEAS